MWNKIKLFWSNLNGWRFFQCVIVGYSAGQMYFETGSIWRGVLNGFGILALTWVGEYAYRRQVELEGKK